MADRSQFARGPGAAIATATVADVLRRAGSDPAGHDRPALRFDDLIWTHGEYFAECCRWARLFTDRLPRDAPPHVGVLLDNTPDFTFALGGAALAGAVVVGLNHTHRGQFLADDIHHTDVALLVTEPRHEPALAAITSDFDVPVLVSHRFPTDDIPDPGSALTRREDLDAALHGHDPSDPGLDVGPADLFTLIFTSGTSGRPKAVMYDQGRVAAGAASMVGLLEMTADDVAYMAMPLFHSQSLYVNWGPVMVAGASSALCRRFSASRWLADIRRHGATVTNYTGTPLGYLLAQPERADDADNPLRVAYGNEGASPRLAAFEERFGVHVIEVYGATEGSWGVYRDERTPPDALGPIPDGVIVVDEEGAECPRAVFDSAGALANASDCIGEMVDTRPNAPFPGYYKSPDATAAATRRGWVWSGDLGYVDADGFVYFAGRTSERIRVGGENFAAAPIEAVIARHPDVTAVAVYAVPDVEAGDQVMAAVVLRAGAEVAAIARWIHEHPSLATSWCPRYLRVCVALPVTASQKVLKRQLAHEKFRLDRVGNSAVHLVDRATGETARLDDAAHDELRARFEDADRVRYWDL